ncbi:MAG: hypothetical protein RMN51_12840 [Verrucomicrobiota bacterium]|nr:hypothetical protein [Verrucomicrobiota bacterium]
MGTGFVGWISAARRSQTQGNGWCLGWSIGGGCNWTAPESQIAGLIHMASLQELESLNLSGTEIREGDLLVLAALPQLRRLFLWQTQVTPESVRVLLEKRVQCIRLAAAASHLRLHAAESNLLPSELELELGARPICEPVAPGIPLNTICPVSDKLARRSSVLWHEGRLVAFCGEDCRAVFEKAPSPFDSRLAQLASPSPGQLAARAVSSVCPVTGRPVQARITMVHEGCSIAFCCPECRARFAAAPAMDPVWAEDDL